MPDTSLRAAPVGAVDHLWRWQLRAACRGRPDLFFHPPGEREPHWTRREQAAKQVCASCPVQHDCAAFALTSHEPYGTWGGMTARERELALRAGRTRRQPRHEVQTSKAAEPGGRHSAAAAASRQRGTLKPGHRPTSTGPTPGPAP